MANSRHGNGKTSIISSSALVHALPAAASQLSPYMRALCTGAIFFVLALFLARGVVSQVLAPLGAAFVAAAVCTASVGRINALCALLGAVMGYLLPSPADGLKYCAAAVICCTAGMILSDRTWIRGRFAPPVLSACSLLATNTVYLFSYGVTVRDAALYMCEIVMAMAAAFLYIPLAAFVNRAREAKTETPPNRKALKHDLLRKTGCVVGAGFSLVLVLSGLPLFAGMNAGRAAAIYICMAVCSADPLAGCVCGIGLGFAAALGGGAAVQTALIYAVSALIAGLFAAKGGFAVALIFTICHAALLVWLDPQTGMSAVYECFFSGVIFYISAYASTRAAQRLMRAFSACAEDPESDTRLPVLETRLSSAANAFEAAAQDAACSEQRQDSAIERDIYTLALDRVCRNCGLCASCHKLSGKITREALEEAKSHIIAKGHASPEDFPPFFSARCTHMPDFLGAVNEFIALRESRARYARRARDDALVLSSQYGAIVEFFREMMTEFAPSDPNCLKENTAVRTALAKADIAVGIEVEKEHGRYKCTVKSSAQFPAKLRKNLETITSSALGCAVRFDRTDMRTDRQVMREYMPYTVSAASAGCAKSGEDESGDRYACFKTGDGLAYFVICDGMGSGRGAGQESAVFLRMLEHFLRAGVKPETALKLIYPAYTIRCGGDMFTTCDILRIDLYSGQAASYKCAAAPTYICPYGASPRKISSVSLPVGIAGSTPQADKCMFELSEGDVIVMMSDGAMDEDERRIYAFLQHSRGCEPRKIASQLLEDRTADGQVPDDMTVIAVRVDISR